MVDDELVLGGNSSGCWNVMVGKLASVGVEEKFVGMFVGWCLRISCVEFLINMENFHLLLVGAG